MTLSKIEQTHSIVIRAYCKVGTDEFTHAIVDDNIHSYFLSGATAEELIDRIVSAVQEPKEHYDNNVHGIGGEIYGGD